MRRSRWWRWFAAVALVAVATSGCGLSEDDGPRDISTDAVPEELLATTDTTTTTAPTGATTTVEVYFQADDGEERLQAVEREVETPVEREAVFNELLAGTRSTEEARGLRNRLPSDLRLVSEPNLARGTLFLDLSEDFDDITSGPQVTAFAQLVFTGTALPGVERVRFEVEGEPRPASTSEGTEDAVDRRNYPELRPR